MRCSKARTLWIERDLGIATPGRAQMLERHLGSCAGCSRWAIAQARLGTDLRALRAAPPPEIDVTARVLRELRSARVPPREPRLAQLGAAALVACTVAVLILVGVGLTAPPAGELAGDAGTLGRGLMRALGGLVATFGALLAAGSRSLARLAGSAGTIADQLRLLEPVAILLIAGFTAIAATTVTLVVGRDLARPAWIREEAR